MKTLLAVLALSLVVHAKTLTNNGANNLFGYSISVSGDTMVIAEYGQRLAYVYEQTTSGWQGVASIMSTRADNITSVAISGTTIVAGSSLDCAYIFEMPEGGWSRTVNQSATLTPSDGYRGNQFGNSVAINGSTVVVGAYQGGNVQQGEAYVYIKPESGWANMTETAQLHPSDGMQNSYFGWSLAVSGVQVIVGAPGNPYGKVYVFQEPVSGWSGSLTETAQLTDANLGGHGQLGSSVGIHGTTVISGEPVSGQVMIYNRVGQTWTSTSTPNAILTQNTESTAFGFGQSVAIDSNTIIVGDTMASNPNWHRSGAAFYFAEPQGGWSSMTQTAKVTPPGSGTGYTVALGRTGKLIVGAPDTPMYGNENQGAVFIVAP